MQAIFKRRDFNRILLCCLAITLAPRAKAETFEWQKSNPESEGMSSAKLDALKEALAPKTRALLVIRNDKVVYEWYGEGQSATMKQSTASLAKAIVGGLSLALAIDDRRIALDDPASKYVPAWKNDPRRSKITIRHLGSHTSGIDDSHNRAEQAQGINQMEYTGWAGDFWRWREKKPPHDAFTISRDVAPLLFDAGADFQYSNPGIALLGYCVTASLKGSPHPDLRSLLRERIMKPIGVDDDEWSCGYGITMEVDGLPMVANWGGGNYTPRAAARIGRLLLRKGDWQGQRLLSEAALNAVTSDAGLPGPCGMGWWTNEDRRFAALPKDAVWGLGAGHQVLLVIPSLNLIMVRNGSDLHDRKEKRDRIGDVLFAPLIESIVERDQVSRLSPPAPPYPASTVITGIDWASPETIVRQAKGCDNWPLTWADDGDLYGAYGDGNGFAPYLNQKLSLGVAKISGGPNDFKGVNVRSADIELLGEGAKGKKASGILMVDGVIYMFVRNAANSQLVWSSDHGNTWMWSEWKWTESFGSPTFLNFGQNYSGARDKYVYVYSSDVDSAYEPADRMVLARVALDRIRDRQEYEFFTQLDAKGAPQWTKDLAKRGSAFDHPRRCYRSGITYNAALKRYLWCQILPESTHSGGPRFQGGFGIYESAEPWGPWRTVFFTNEWDVGPGETSSFPTKWMSADGRTIHLVFSGDDYFSVRQATLTVHP